MIFKEEIQLHYYYKIDIVDTTKVDNKAPLSQIKVLPFKEKNDWNLTAKYNIGKKIEGTDGGDAGTKV